MLICLERTTEQIFGGSSPSTAPRQSHTLVGMQESDDVRGQRGLSAPWSLSRGPATRPARLQQHLLHVPRSARLETRGQLRALRVSEQLHDRFSAVALSAGPATSLLKHTSFHGPLDLAAAGNLLKNLFSQEFWLFFMSKCCC